jgi:hypothetical protein
VEKIVGRGGRQVANVLQGKGPKGGWQFHGDGDGNGDGDDVGIGGVKVEENERINTKKQKQESSLARCHAVICGPS